MRRAWCRPRALWAKNILPSSAEPCRQAQEGAPAVAGHGGFVSICRLVERLTAGFALGGGVIFIALIAMSIVSIVGRKLASAPILGDLELMQVGTAIGAAAFLPYCEIHDRHIRVDALTDWLPSRIRAAFDSCAHAGIAVVAGLLTWRTALQCIEVQATREVSTLLSVPMWMPMAFLLPSLLLLGAAALCRMFRTLELVRTAGQ